ncbi:glycerol-3-phosphate dehydrogenase [mine drainage metagenome]|uniref:Glycerol-3-phosphate dehydrogenase n=1 Tax=mine drainage metagenome TaxID=410659 RepID=A0A1J5S7E9_9ZZZZ
MAVKIAVLGAGAWGTALAIALARDHEATLWARDPAQVELLRAQRENERYLPGMAFPEALSISGELLAAVQGAELALVATPLAGLRSTLASLREAAPRLPFLWLCKGLEAGSGLLPHQVAAEEMSGDLPCGALTGPSFAQEVARGLPTALCLAARDAHFAHRWVHALSGPRLRLYANDDVVGAEVGGAVKNVLAIATGISDGLGLGNNARAALITRGLAEITRFGMALGGRRETFMGLAGMGDLILTCTGDLSRNRRVGLALASGRPLAAISRELGHVAEGVSSAQEVARRAATLGVDMPITAAVCAVLAGAMTPSLAVEQLMGRDPREE